MEKILNYYAESTNNKPVSTKDVRLIEGLCSRYKENIVLNKLYWFVADKGLNIYSTTIREFAEYVEVTDHRGLTPVSNDSYACEYVYDIETGEYVSVFKVIDNNLII
jgi:hypothetical protein